MTDEAIRVPLSVFFDYVCPFCYVASVRLERLAARQPIAIHWRFIEIHPDNPPQGRPLAELGYPPAQWAQMQAALEEMCRSENIPLAERTFTTNSRRALLLGQAVLDQRPERFHAVHRAIFEAYFVHRRNIGDPEVLQSIARDHGVADIAEAAWTERHYLERLLEHVEAARELGLTGVPALVVADRTFTGAVSIDTLEQALAQHH